MGLSNDGPAHLYPFQRQDQRQGTRRRRDESVMGIEGRCLFRQGMHQESADTKDQACGPGALDGIAEQSDAEAPSLPGPIDGQAPQDRHRNGVGHVAPDAPGRFPQRQRARGQTVIPDHRPFSRNDVGARSATDLIVPGAANQPLVKRLDTGGETLDAMRLSERRRSLEGHTFHGLGAAIRRS
ncbi:hypothetical protein THIOKS1850022 [Thiocapsa sp. KS1]|nr:hypothetical protein THIOKS1850022 [Thiocapsa sp. KS1]